ncbi:MAG: XRE family transcriptional regulator [Rhodocyclaceae bacterium]|nr:MAG: XRE family transcriptional regulator [Rhodocyclaceae bacterium]
MYFQETGAALKAARKNKQITQANLAKMAGLSRVTVNQLENGGVVDLGAKKLFALLSAVGLEVSVTPKQDRSARRNYLQMACTSANVSYKESLTPEELISALTTGTIPSQFKPHLRVIFDEAPDTVFQGMLEQVSTWGSTKRIHRNAEKLARQIGSRRTDL